MQLEGAAPELTGHFIGCVDGDAQCSAEGTVCGEPLSAAETAHRLSVASPSGLSSRVIVISKPSK